MRNYALSLFVTAYLQIPRVTLVKVKEGPGAPPTETIEEISQLATTSRERVDSPAE